MRLNLAGRRRVFCDAGCGGFAIVVAFTAVTLLAFADQASAATRTKGNNTNNLNLTTSWVGGVVPGSGDIALWDSTVTTANTVSLGADLNFGEVQIRTTNPGGDVTINTGNTLTLSGVSGVGIDMSTAVHDLRINCDLALAGAQAWNVNNTTLTVGNVSNGGNLLTINGNSNVRLNGVISGAGGLSTSGFANLFVQSSNTYTGVTRIDNSDFIGTVANINTPSSIGKGSAAGSAADLIIAGSGILQVHGSTDRLFTLGDASGLTANIQDDGSSLNFTGTGAIALGGNGPRFLTLGGTASDTFAPVIGDGPGGATSLFIENFGGSWTFTGANTYTGGTQLISGTVTVNAGGTLGAGGGSLEVDSFLASFPTVLNLNVNQSVGSLSGTVFPGGSATINIASGKTLTVSQLTDTTYEGVIAGAGSLQKSLTGTLTLTGSNSYTGITTIAAFSTISVSSLANGGSNSNIGASSNLAGNLVLQGGTLRYTGAAVSTDRLFTLGDGFAGGIDASGTGPVNFTNAGSMGLQNSNSRTLNLFGTNTGDNTLAAVIGDNGGPTDVRKSGTGKWVLTGASSYTGATTITGGILEANTLADGGNNSSLGASALASSNLVIDGGTLRYIGSGSSTNRSFTVGPNGAAIDASGTGALIFRSTTLQTISGTGDRTFTLTGTNTGANALRGGVGDPTTSGMTSLVKNGTGTWMLTGGNAYTGSTTVNTGTLNVDDTGTASGRISATSSITVNSGGTLLLSGDVATTSRIANAATMTLNGGTFGLNGVAEGTVASAGVGALTLSSTSTIDLAGTSLLHLAASNTKTWTGTLNILDWDGMLVAGGGSEQLLFGTTVSGLTAAQLLQIEFVNPAGLPAGNYLAAWATAADGELVPGAPIPEPAPWFTAVLLTGILGFRARKQIARLVRRQSR